MQRLTYAAVKALVAKKQSGDRDMCILDVRSADEVAGGAIAASVNIPLDQLESALQLTTDEFKEKYKAPKPETSDHVVTYCLRGMRAESAAALLRSSGYTHVDVYPGSWTEWSEKEKCAA
ncbi:putative Rhodanese-like domain containing protein [Leishmania naiffi]|uniref:Sulfurtransferase n=1 Tax=Leishmania naiffi TaxID=5678 RepID=A0AAW3C8Y4_9TRYP